MQFTIILTQRNETPYQKLFLNVSSIFIKIHNINKAYAKGIHEAWGLKRWAKTTRQKIYKELKTKEGLTKKQVDALPFEDIFPYITKYESGDQLSAMNINAPAIAKKGGLVK